MTVNRLAKQTIRAAELLRSLSGSSGNPLVALLSYFEPILLDMNGQIFDPKAFASAMRASYGWNFTEDVADGFRRQLLSRGWLQQKRRDDGMPEYVDGQPVQIVNYDSGGLEFKGLHEKPVEEAIDRITTSFDSFLDSTGIDAQNVPQNKGNYIHI